MLSSCSQCPLISSATASSSSVSTSSSSSSSSPATTHKRKSRSVISFPVFGASLPTFSLLLVAMFISCLTSSSLASASPFTSSPSRKTWKHISDNHKHFVKEDSKKGKEIFLEDMYQNDESPRSFGNADPNQYWGVQPQKRIHYLRADNDQFLQLHGDKITGTTEQKPPFGIVRFFSHLNNILIRSFHEHKFLCMNASHALYLSTKGDDPECYIEEKSLNGSYLTAFHFTKYKGDREYYLGIDCDPILGSKADRNQKSSRFFRIDLSEGDAEAAKANIDKDGPEKYLMPKCVSKRERRKQAARAKLRKLRWRWCWNIERIAKKRDYYNKKCRDRPGNKKQCSGDVGKRGSRRCVCDILIKMLDNLRRTKRKCLREKLSKWVENQKGTSNSQAIREASKLLVPKYGGIANRMRMLKARRTKKKQRRKKRRRWLVKLNYVLTKYPHELMLPRNNTSFVEEPSFSAQTNMSVNSGSDFVKNKELSVLSDSFKNDLNSLPSAPKRRRQSHRKRRKHRSRKKSQG